MTHDQSLGGPLLLGLTLAVSGCGGAAAPSSRPGAEEAGGAETGAGPRCGGGHSGAGDGCARQRGRRGEGGPGPRAHAGGRGGDGPRGRGRGGGRGRGPRGPGPGGGGRGAGPPTEAQRADFHGLLAAHRRIERRVELRPDGAETWTTSPDPEVAARIQRHVRDMRGHLEGGGRVRMWDPLFAALVDRYEDMELSVEEVEGGVHVVHRGRTPEAVALIRAHARVVTAFVEDGFAEARREHPVPTAPED